MTFPRETIEFLPVTITVDGAAVTTGIEFSVNPLSTRPTTWSAPYILGLQSGILISGYTAGVYVVWAKVTAAPEAVVVDCGQFTIT